MPNAVTCLIELKASSAAVDPSAYAANDRWVYLTMNEEHILMDPTIATIDDNNMRAMRQLLTKLTMKAVPKFAHEYKVRESLPVRASWIRFVSAVILVVISPAPRTSKNAMFWRRMAARYFSRSR